MEKDDKKPEEVKKEYEKPKTRKKIIILFSIIILLVLIVGIMVILLINRNEDDSDSKGSKIPKKYQGEYVLYGYYLLEGEPHAYESHVKIGNYSLDYTTYDKLKNKEKKDEGVSVSYEVKDNDLIMITKHDNGEGKRYCLVEDDELYLSSDKTVDEYDQLFVKVDSDKDKLAQYEYAADRMAKNIEKNMSEWATEIDEVNNPSLVEDDLTAEEEKKNEDDLVTYMKRYSLGYNNGKIEIEVSKRTGKVNRIDFSNDKLNTEGSLKITRTSLFASIYCLKIFDHYEDVNVIEKDKKYSKEQNEAKELFNKLVKDIDKNYHNDAKDDDITADIFFVAPITSAYTYNTMDGSVSWWIYIL